MHTAQQEGYIACDVYCKAYELSVVYAQFLALVATSIFAVIWNSQQRCLKSQKKINYRKY